MRELRLRTSLILLLVTAVTLTFSLVGTAILLYRLPQIEANNRADLQERAKSASRLLDHYMAGIEAQIRTQARLVANRSPAELQAYLEAIVGEGGTMQAAYVVAADGSVEALGLPGIRRQAAAELRGADFSNIPLFQSARAAAAAKGDVAPAIWSDNFLSALSGKLAVGVAVPAGDKVVIGEVALERVLAMFSSLDPGSESFVVVIDHQGQWLAASRDNPAGRFINYAALPTFQAIVSGRALPEYEISQGERFLVGGVLASNLNWVITAATPAGTGSARYLSTIFLVVGGFAGSLLLSMALAPLWAARMVRPLNALIERTHRVIEGDYGSPWPRRGAISELNQLSMDLGRMVEVIQTREAGMARSEERLRATLESTPSIAVQWFDASGRVLYWNKASEIMFGFTAAEAVGSVIGENLLMYLDRQQAEDFIGVLSEIDRSGKPFGPAEFPLRKKDGDVIVVLATTFAIPGEGDSKIYVCMDVDVTERKRAEADLLDSEKKLEAIFNASPAAMSVTDVNNCYRVITVNAAWEKQFQRQRQDVTGLNGLEMGLWAEPADRDRLLAAVNSGSTPDAMEAELLAGDGRRMLCRISAQITEIRGNLLLLMMTVDITEQRRIENEIRELNAELEQRVARRTGELSKANVELAASVENLRTAQKQLVQSEKLAALGNLVAGIAHELNTPIGNAVTVASTLFDHHRQISGQLQTGLTRSSLKAFIDTLGEAASILERNLHRAAELIGNFRQIAVDQASYQRRTFDLREAVEEVRLVMTPAIRKSPVALKNEVPEGILMDGYPGPLTQALMILVNNSLIHAFAGRDCGSIRIEASAPQSGSVQLRFSDDGAGIPAANLGRIFEPFFTTRLGQGGSGLGLHILFNLVTGLLGGRVGVNSDHGRGTEFVFDLPLSAPVIGEAVLQD